MLGRPWRSGQVLARVPRREPLCSERPPEGRTGHHLGKGLPPHPPPPQNLPPPHNLGHTPRSPNATS